MRHWSPTTKQTQFPLPFVAPEAWPTVLEIAPDELYVHDGTTIAQYDGTGWKQLAKATKKIEWAARAAKGDVWVRYEGDAVEHATPTGLVAVPMPEPTLSISGIDKGAPWAVGLSGKLFKRVNDTWTPVPLPAPAFGTSTAVKAKDVMVAAPDSFQSWPPFATPECKTPFVVLARQSQAKAKSVLGARAKDVDSAKKLAAFAAAKNRLRPEVVCGEPPATKNDVTIE